MIDSTLTPSYNIVTLFSNSLINPGMKVIVMYFESYNHPAISRQHQAFASNLPANEDVLRPEIYESWLRSQTNGVFPFPQTLPARFSREYIFNNIIKDYYRMGTNLTRSFQETQSKYLSSLKIAFFYADENLTLFDPKGNVEIRSELRKINFGGGSNLKESAIGTNAAALAQRSQVPSWCIGAEHYLKSLHDYIMLCLPVHRKDFSGKFSLNYYTLLVTKLENFTPMLEDFFDYFSATQSLLRSSEQWDPFQLHIIGEILYLNMERNNLGIIMTDSNGIILDLNARLTSLFDRSPFDIIGKPLTAYYPELAPALNCLKTGENLTLHEVRFQKLLASMHMDCQVVKNKTENIGLFITLSDNAQIQKITHKVVNFNAHYKFDDLIGQNPLFIQSKNLAKRAALSSSTVLITGESGTGKELFAQSIHTASARRNFPFVSINCAAIPRELIGSELFGYVEGAFTGARKGGARGKFELANKGTLFLDEIAELPLEMQSILLRALEEKEIVRLGDTSPIPVNVRIIAATNKNLKELVTQGTFRSDLYYRINVLHLEVPPLRDRLDDIPRLTQNLTDKFTAAFGKNHIQISPEALQILQSYTWPGNIRELRNIIERAVNLCTSSLITVHDLPMELLTSPDLLLHQNAFAQMMSSVQTHNSEQEKALIQSLLLKHRGNKSKVAQEMGISRQTLYRKMHAFL